MACRRLFCGAGVRRKPGQTRSQPDGSGPVIGVLRSSQARPPVGRACSMASIAELAGHVHEARFRTGSRLPRFFGRPVSRDVIGALRRAGLIAAGPRSPQPGAPYTYVTTQSFLVQWGLESLRDLPDYRPARRGRPARQGAAARRAARRPRPDGGSQRAGRQRSGGRHRLCVSRGIDAA